MICEDISFLEKGMRPCLFSSERLLAPSWARPGSDEQYAPSLLHGFSAEGWALSRIVCVCVCVCLRVHAVNTANESVHAMLQRVAPATR